LNIATPVKKTRRQTTSALTTINETPKRKIKRNAAAKVNQNLTPRSKLAKEIDDLSLRRSKRHSAAQANFNIMDRGDKDEKNNDNDDDGDNDRSDESTEEETTDEDSDQEIMKTPKKRARPWRGAKTPTKTPKKSSSSRQTAKTPTKTPSKKGNAPQMFEQKKAPKRVVLPDFITQSNDLTNILAQASTRLGILFLNLDLVMMSHH